MTLPCPATLSESELAQVSRELLVVIITCPLRAGNAVKVAASLERCGVPPEAIYVQMDDESAGSATEKMVRNTRNGIEAFLRWKREWLIFLEDDVIPNRFLWQNMLNWLAELRADLSSADFLGSLYNPNIRGRHTDWRTVSGRYYEADPDAFYGSQALVLSRKFAEYACNHWEEQGGLQDIKLSRLAARGGYPVLMHAPSLVEHAGAVPSTWGGTAHSAVDFRPYWPRCQFIENAGRDAWQAVHGYFDFKNLYREVVAELSPPASGREAILVEIGNYLGRSLIFLGAEVVKSGKLARVIGVDNFDPSVDPALDADLKTRGIENLRDAFHTNVRGAGLTGILEHMPMASIDAAKEFADGTLHFVFIDGDHRFESVLNDLAVWWPKVEPRGILAGHDIHTYASVGNAAKEFCAMHSLRLEIDASQNIWFIRKRN